MLQYRYTSYDLEQSIDVARALLRYGTGGAASADELATFLDYSSTKNGAFLTRIANAKLFGLISGQSARLTVTRRGMDILKPDQPSTEGRARLEAFLAVPLYEAFLEKWQGRLLPDDTGVQNSLQVDFGISEDKASFVHSRLIESADQAGLFKVARNRTKLIRPTFGDTQSESVNASEGSADETSTFTAVESTKIIATPRSNKLLEGVLELLPEDEWDEGSLQAWLALLELALRNYYRIPSREGRSMRASDPEGSATGTPRG